MMIIRNIEDFLTKAMQDYSSLNFITIILTVLSFVIGSDAKCFKW